MGQRGAWEHLYAQSSAAWVNEKGTVTAVACVQPPRGMRQFVQQHQGITGRQSIAEIVQV